VFKTVQLEPIVDEFLHVPGRKTESLYLIFRLVISVVGMIVVSTAVVLTDELSSTEIQ